MTDLKKNVPELRFPEFESEWEEKKLSDLGSYSKSYSFSRDVEGEGKVHHIHYGDIHSKLPSKISDINLLPTIKESKDFEFLQKGDIIFADASEDYKDLGKAIMVDIDEDNIIAGLHTHVFRPNLQVVSEFLMYYTKTLNYFKFIKRQGTGISVLGISKKNLSNFILGAPEYKEQQKIGDFFSKLDRQIELEEQKLALLEEQKKGYMQKVFSQELRFKDDNGNDYPEWEEKKLSDLGSYSKSYSFSRDVEGEGKVHHIHYGDIHSKLPSKISDINLLPTIKESKDFEFLQKGDIIFADASEDYKDLGKAIMVDIDEDNIIAGLHTHVFRPNLQIVSEFLMYYTKTLNYFKFIKRQGTGISVLGISKKNLSNFVLGLPERREQQKIGDFFSKLDQQIELQGQKIESLKQRKNGLLQKMFV